MNRRPMFLERIQRRAQAAGEFAAIVVVAILAIAAYVHTLFAS